MKIRNLLNLVVVLLIGQFLFACSSAKYYEFAANKPAAFNKAKEKTAPETEKDVEELSLAAIAKEETAKKAAEKEDALVLEASVGKATPIALPKHAVTPTHADEEVKAIAEAEALAMAKEKIASMTKAEKREFKKELKEAYKQDRGSRTSIIEIVLAVLLPPLAVFLHDGIGTSFWVNIILTLLLFIPGVIHALLVVTDSI